MSEVTIGVLALQGAFREHIAAFTGLRCRTVEVRTAAQLAECDGLVLPGGESTAISLIAQRTGMWEPLLEWVRSGRPTWGTCAGMILLADRVTGSTAGQAFLGGMDISVHRNYFGSQVASTVTPMDLEPAFLAELSRDDEPAALAKEGPPSGVFIRAPAIVALGQRATALAWVSLPPGAAPLSVATAVSLATPQPVCVAARQGRCLATAFHPELTAHRAFHRLFVRMVAGAGGAGARGGPLPPAGSPDAAAAGGSHGAPAAVLADIPLPIAPLGVLPAVIGSPAVGPRLTPGTTAASSCLK